jgi:hypothetical protein
MNQAAFFLTSASIYQLSLPEVIKTKSASGGEALF